MKYRIFDTEAEAITAEAAAGLVEAQTEEI